MLGIDIIDIARVQTILKRNGEQFIIQIMTDNERQYIGDVLANSETFAGIWAAKEAAVKALGTGFAAGIIFKDIEISHDQWGAPYYQFYGKFRVLLEQKSYQQSYLSISHSRLQAVAVAMFH